MMYMFEFHYYGLINMSAAVFKFMHLLYLKSEGIQGMFTMSLCIYFFQKLMWDIYGLLKFVYN